MKNICMMPYNYYSELFCCLWEPFFYKAKHWIRITLNFTNILDYSCHYPVSDFTDLYQSLLAISHQYNQTSTEIFRFLVGYSYNFIGRRSRWRPHKNDRRPSGICLEMWQDRSLSWMAHPQVRISKNQCIHCICRERPAMQYNPRPHSHPLEHSGLEIRRTFIRD